jgi:hypothetical protein
MMIRQILREHLFTFFPLQNISIVLFSPPPHPRDKQFDQLQIERETLFYTKQMNERKKEKYDDGLLIPVFELNAGFFVFTSADFICFSFKNVESLLCFKWCHH